MELKIANYLQKQLVLSDEDKEVILYALTILNTSILGYCLIFIVGWIFNVLESALIAVVTTSTLRIFSGGAHASKRYKCIGFGGIIFPGIGWLVAHLNYNFKVVYLILSVFLITGLAIYYFAPADTPEKPITTKQDNKRLKSLSFSVLFIWLVLMSLYYLMVVDSSSVILASSLGLIWQSFTLTPLGYRFISFIDGLIDKNRKSR